MTAQNALLQPAFMLAQDLTRGLRGWIQDNVVRSSSWESPSCFSGSAAAATTPASHAVAWSDRRPHRVGHRGLRQRPPDRRVPRPPDHGLNAVLVRTDDEVYRVDSVWLGPPRATFPWRARYVSYRLGLVVMILVMFVQRRVGIGLDFFSVAWALVLDRRHPVPRKTDRLRAPAGQVVELFRHEVRGPRAWTTVAGGRSGPGTSASRVLARVRSPRGPEEGRVRAAARSSRRRAAIPAAIPAATRAGRCPPRSRAGGAAATWRARRTCPNTPRTSRCARSTGI